MSKNPIPIPPQPENPDPQIREMLKKLTKRDCRKICAPLKIQQTYKGKEINTNSMKNAVLEKFDSNSELVLQVLAKYLPELMAQKQAAWAKVSLTQSSPTIRVAFSEIIPRKLFP